LGQEQERPWEASHGTDCRHKLKAKCKENTFGQTSIGLFREEKITAKVERKPILSQREEL
jgi:hypothetical protein